MIDGPLSLQSGQLIDCGVIFSADFSDGGGNGLRCQEYHDLTKIIFPGRNACLASEIGQAKRPSMQLFQADEIISSLLVRTVGRKRSKSSFLPSYPPTPPRSEFTPI